MIRPVHCSLSLYSQERERKTHSSVFLFTTTNSSKGNPIPQVSGHGLQVPKPKRGGKAAPSFRTAWRVGAQHGDGVGTGRALLGTLGSAGASSAQGRRAWGPGRASVGPPPGPPTSPLGRAHARASWRRPALAGGAPCKSELCCLGDF